MQITSNYFAATGAKICVLFAIVTLSACSKTATEESEDTRARVASVATANGAWSVNGAALSQTVAELEAARGKSISSQNNVLTWADGLTVELDSNKRIIKVYGNSLLIGTTPVIDSALTVDQAQKVLARFGDGDRKVVRSPKGSGVISTGYIISNTSLTYEHEGAFFQLAFGKDNQFTAVKLQRRDPRIKP